MATNGGVHPSPSEATTTIAEGIATEGAAISRPDCGDGEASSDVDSVDAKPVRSLTPPLATRDNDPPETSHSMPATPSIPAAAGDNAASSSATGRRSRADDDPDARGFNISGYAKQVMGGGGTSYAIQDTDELYTTLTQMDDAHYNLSEGRRLAIVFNHENYHPSRGLGQRRGTESDCQAIEKTFKQTLGFDVHTYDDLSVDRIRNVIRDIQTEEVELACLAVFILTHGEENGILHSYDSSYKLDKEIISELLPEPCPSLAGKPKMIFVQACQGKATDDGSVIRPRSRHTSTDGGLSGSNYRIPHYSDFLIFQAAYHGYYSFRSSGGSWFIQALCKSFEHSACGEEVHSILTRAKHCVACYKISNVPSDKNLDRKKQIPLVQDTLIRSLYLKGAPPARNRSSSRTESRSRSLQATPETKRRNGSMKDAAKSPKKERKGGRAGDQMEKCICM